MKSECEVVMRLIYITDHKCLQLTTEENANKFFLFSFLWALQKTQIKLLNHCCSKPSTLGYIYLPSKFNGF